MLETILRFCFLVVLGCFGFFGLFGVFFSVTVKMTDSWARGTWYASLIGELPVCLVRLVTGSSRERGPYHAVSASFRLAQWSTGS